jgi:thiamine monophosphate synthase
MAKNIGYLKKNFIYINKINESIKFNIQNSHNTSIIYDNVSHNNESFYKIKNFCKLKNLNLYLIDNYKLAIKHKLSGIIISNNNKRNLYYGNPLCKKIKFQIFGKVHNRLEYYFKKRQNCTGIFLSPIFHNKKYSMNSILNISKFSLISRNWNIEKYALGGIMPQNFRKLKNLDISGLAVRRAFLMNKLDTKFKLFSRKQKNQPSF